LAEASGEASQENLATKADILGLKSNILAVKSDLKT